MAKAKGFTLITGKKLFAHKEILAPIMKAYLSEFQDCSLLEIINPIEGNPEVDTIPVGFDETNQAGRIRGDSTEDSSLTEGSIRYDVRFYAISPKGERAKVIINLEAQSRMGIPGYIIKRGFYYCSRLLSAQKGVEFYNDHHEDIRKVYSIWICPAPHKGWENTVNKYEIKESCLVGNQEERPEHYDLMTMILIWLGGEDYPRYDGVLELLDVLLSVEKQATEKLDIVEKSFQSL